MEYIVRLGPDIVIKSKRIRARFIGRLVRNIERSAKRNGLDCQVTREWSRLLIKGEKPELLDLLRRTFGVSSVSRIEHECSGNLQDICETAHAHYQERVTGKTFAVRGKRVGKHDYTSMDLMKKVGSALYDGSAGVNLRTPDVEIYVEVREDKAFFYSERHGGPGGLPLGVSGRVLCLLSGGFDSAVASWMMQKRGIHVDYLFCNLAGEAYEKSVLGLAKLLAEQWALGTNPTLYILDMQPVAHEIRTKVKASYAQIMLKRAFYRLAERAAAKTGAEAILTGECIGQVSSQTLPNLRAIETAATLPVLRPLLGFDKDEIIARSRMIGTYAISSGVEEYCQLVPEKPVTACTPEAAQKQEAFMDLKVLDDAFATLKEVDLMALSQADLVTPFLYRDEIGTGDVVIDCRPFESYELWHYPGARNIEFFEILADHTILERHAQYVLYCPVGLQSAVLAEKLQKLGYKAHSFRGGLSGIKKFLDQGTVSH